MTKEEAKELSIGIYRIYWSKPYLPAGESSLAAVGQLYDGSKWFAPVNWTSPDERWICSADWRNVERVEKIDVAEPKKKEVDMTDDWMNPSSTSCSYTYQKPENKVEYNIERCKRQICFGVPGYIDDWRVWATYDSAETRDNELYLLNLEHPMWRLRARNRNPYLESIGIFPTASQPGINE